MIVFPMRWHLPAALCAAALSSVAQTAPPAGHRPDPLDAGASVPAVAYASSLSRQRRPVGDKAIAWREANDAAARVGGWRTYAREAQQPQPAPAAAAVQPSSPDPKAPPAPQGHGGHKMP